MLLRFLLLALPFAIAFPQFTPAPQPRLVELPLLDCAGLPCIDLTTGSGKTLRMVIDLGEVNAYLDLKAAQSLGVSLQSLKGTGGADINEVQQTVVPGAHLGDLPLGDFPFMVLDTTPQPDKPGQPATPFPADGALTYGAFKNRLVQIDGTKRVLRVSEPESDPPPCPRECSNLVIKHFGNWGPVTLTAEGFTLNGQPLDVQLDTTFTGTLLVYPAAIEKLGLKKQSKAKPKETFPYAQGGIKLARSDEGAIAFRGIALLENGPLYFATPDAHLPPVQFDATVGIGLLDRGIANFDFKGMHFWFDAAASPAPAN